MNTRPPQSESETNTGEERRAWHARRPPAERALLERDAAVYVKQSVSTPGIGAVVAARGATLVTADGRELLDFHGNSAHQLGYGHPRIVEALTAQLHELPFAPRRYTSEPSVRFAEELVRRTAEPLQRVLMCTGGSDAIEIALKLARVATGRHKTLSFWEAFHGAGFGASSVGGEQLFRSGPLSPGIPGTEHVPPFGCRDDILGPHHSSREPHTDECGRVLARAIDYTLTVQGDVAALVAEPMRATPAVAPPGFWEAVRESCTRTGTLLIFDEIPTGLGRTGRLFAHEHEGVVPDILVLGKGLGGGALPVAAVVARAELDVAQDWAIGHYTHEKNPLMARAALTTLEVIDEEGLVERSERLGVVAGERLWEMADRHPVVADIRGRGLALGVELDAGGPADRTTEFAERAMYAALDRGLSFKVSMGRILTLFPPLTVTEEELDRALDALDGALTEAAGTRRV